MVAHFLRDHVIVGKDKVIKVFNNCFFSSLFFFFFYSLTVVSFPLSLFLNP